MRRRMVVAIALTAVAIAGCSGSDGGDDGAEAASASVSLVDFGIEAPSSVAAGTVVTVVNDGEAPHNWTADDGSFSTADLAAGEEATVTLSTPGSYSYTCTIHPEQMTGSIEVAG